MKLYSAKKKKNKNKTLSVLLTHVITQLVRNTEGTKKPVTDNNSSTLSRLHPKPSLSRFEQKTPTAVTYGSSTYHYRQVHLSKALSVILS